MQHDLTTFKLPQAMNTISGKLKIEIKHGLKYEGNQAWGLFNFGKDFNIQLERDMEYQIAQQSFIHEIIHSIEIAHQLSFKEKDIEILATGLLFILKNNPKIVKFLTIK